MIEIAEAINNLASRIESLAFILLVVGLLFLLFKNMGGQK